MNSRFKNILLSLGALTLSQVLHADDQTNKQNMMSSQNMMTPSNMNDQMMITPNAGPVVKDGADIFVDADFIYWTVRQDGLPYAYDGVMGPILGASAPSDGTTDYVTPSGKEYYVKNKMKPGFKVGAGIDLRHDGWDNYLEYTWLHAHASGSTVQGVDTTSPLTSPFIQNLPDSGSVAYINSANASWYIRFNVFDWELGRAFFVSPRLILRPHFGLKGTWQRQVFAVYQNDLTTIESLSSAVLDLGSYKATFNQFYWGVGIRGGLDTSWQFTPNWSIFGNLALSSLWGKFNTLRQDVTTYNDGINPVSTNATVVNVTRDFHSVRAVLELALGLRWDYWFSDDCYRVRVQAGWEEQVWFDQNNYSTSNNSVFDNTNSSLVLQGLTVKFRFDF